MSKRKPTDAEIEAAAKSDPDNPPLTAAQLARMRRVPFAKRTRRKVGLSQEEFARRYQIPLGTLRDWEQGRREPDQAARAFLHVIFTFPAMVQRALGSDVVDDPEDAALYIKPGATERLRAVMRGSKTVRPAAKRKRA